MKRNFVVCVLAGLVMFSQTNFAKAQDVTVIMQEIDELREDLKILQRQNYNGENSELEVRFGHLDELVRTTAGRLDELEYKIKQLNEKIDLINKDIDVRMKLLEGKKISSNQVEPVDNSPKFSAPVAQNAPKALVGASIANDELKPLAKPTAASIYQQGLEALRASNFVVAEENFNQVLKKFPNDKLAGNAQYWLGETYYVRKDYGRAAIAFAKGYQGYSNNPKAADSLLKLGMSMQELGKKEEACTAFKSLKSEFPKAEKALQDKAAEKAKKLGC